MSRLDDAGVDRPDGDFVRGFAFERRDGRGFGIAAERIEEARRLRLGFKGLDLCHAG